jgi:hypothetical protein
MFAYLLAAALAGCGPAAAKLPMAQVPAATKPLVAEPASPPAEIGPRTIRWDEIDLPLGPEAKFEPWMLTTFLRDLDGRNVRIVGYMYGDLFQPTNIREFKLVRHSDCQFGAAGHPGHLIFIELTDSLRTSFTTEPIAVEGTFHIRPFTGPDGRTWALYRMDVTKIERAES